MSRIVAGVDGSEHSRRAVEWATQEARRRGAELELVHAVPEPTLPVAPSRPPLQSYDQMREDLRAQAARLVDTALEGVDTDDIEVERTGDIGSPAQRLCRAAEGAELLVVGARGLGGLRGLLLGSVSHNVIAHAPCPVVVIGPERSRSRRRARGRSRDEALTPV